MQCLVVLLRRLEPAFHQVDLRLRGANPFPRLLLEGVQYIHRLAEPDRIDRSVSVRVEIRHRFQHARAEAGRRLGVTVLQPDPGLIEGKADMVLNIVRKFLQARGAPVMT